LDKGQGQARTDHQGGNNVERLAMLAGEQQAIDCPNVGVLSELVHFDFLSW
jgi:hypothetical protein